ncbi:APC family permease [Mycoplasma todarodis]|uniref:APC family permease n=1 Tax=Mycoplasma todarodis TaxID=1937191 RepID=UPI003B2C2924
MSQKKAKKFGLWTAISLIIGSIVGIGIFFKNIPIFSSAGGNGVVILLAWIFAGLIALGAALAFSEIGTGVHGKAGLSNYVYKLVGKKFGKLCKIVEPTFYHSLLIFALTCYASEAFLQAVLPNTISISSPTVHMGYVILLSAGIYLFFWVLTIISTKAIGIIQNISVILKFIPLVIVAVVGLVGINGIHSGSVFTSGNWIPADGNKPHLVSEFSFSALIMILPAALFAFDGFIHVTNIATDIENPKKNVPLGIIIGMSGVLVLYLLITLAQLITGQSNPSRLLSSIVSSEHARQIIARLLNIFIAIAALGVCNGFIMSQVRSTEAAIEENLLLGSKLFKKKLPKLYGFVYTLMIYMIVAIIIGIPAIIMDSDSIIDASSNYPVLFFFMLYTVLIISQMINRLKIKKISFKNKKIHIEKYEKQKVETKNINPWLFYPLAIISIIGIILSIGYEIFYASLWLVITDPMGQTHYGVFHGATKILNYQAAIIFFITLITFITLPITIYKIQIKRGHIKADTKETNKKLTKENKDL